MPGAQAMAPTGALLCTAWYYTILAGKLRHIVFIVFVLGIIGLAHHNVQKQKLVFFFSQLMGF